MPQKVLKSFFLEEFPSKILHQFSVIYCPPSPPQRKLRNSEVFCNTVVSAALSRCFGTWQTSRNMCNLNKRLVYEHYVAHVVLSAACKIKVIFRTIPWYVFTNTQCWMDNRISTSAHIDNLISFLNSELSKYNAHEFRFNLRLLYE